MTTALDHQPPLNASRAGSTFLFKKVHLVLGKSDGAFFFLNLPSAGLVPPSGWTDGLSTWQLFTDRETELKVFLAFTASG